MSSFSDLIEKFHNVDMLNGSLWDKIIIFSVPLALTMILQQLFNTADVMILGHFVGDRAMAAVGNNIPVIGLIVSLFVGLSIGSNVVVARYIGMGDEKSANEAVHVSVFISIIIGLLAVILIEPFSAKLTHYMGVPAEVSDQTLTYLRFYLLGMPFISLYNFTASLFRARGDTATPLIALFIASAFNITGNLLCVLASDLGTAGVAASTSLSYAVCAFFLLHKLHRHNGVLKLNLGGIFRYDPRKIRAIVNIGLPAGIQGMVFSLSNLVIQSAINSLGADTMAASVAAFNVEIMLYCFVNSFGLSITTFIGQNYGAGNIARCKRVFYVATGINFLVTLTLTALIVLFARQILGEFSANDTIVEIGLIRILYVALPQPVCVLMEGLASAMRGYGYSFPPALATLVAVCGSRLIWIYTVFPNSQTFETIMAVYPISWFLTIMLLIILYVLFIRRLEAKLS